MKNLIKRIIPVVLAVTLAVSTVLAGMMAFASNGNGTVTISNSKVGETYTLYKVMDLVWADGGDGVNNSSDDQYSYTVDSNFDSFFAGKINGYSAMSRQLKDRAAYDYISNVADLSAFATEVANYVDANNIAGIAVTGQANTTVQTNVPYGYYVMIPKDTTTGGLLNTSSVFSVNSVTPAVEIANKSTYPTVSKTVDGAVANSAAIGDTLSYQITSAVPNMAGYSDYTFIVTDTLSSGISLANGFDEDDVTVTVNNQPYTDFTVETAAGAHDSTVVTITFTDFIDLAGQVGDPIVISYEATLNEDAEVGTSGNSNNVYLTYSNDPQTAGTPSETRETSPPTETQTYTSAFQFTKVDANGDPLAGAVFTFAAAAGQNIANVNITSTDGTSAYDSTNSVWTLTTGASGTFLIEGLDEGNYTLTETAAPTSYVKLDQPITVSIVCNEPTTVVAGANTVSTYSDTASSTETGVVDSVSSTTNGRMTFNIVNQTEGRLPQTGMYGLVALIGAGSVLILSAILLNRKKKED